MMAMAFAAPQWLGAQQQQQQAMAAAGF